MEFDNSKVYTSVNADELKIGSKVIVADSMGQLKAKVHEGEGIETLTNVAGDNCLYRFETYDAAYILAYLIEPPEEKKLKWTDLKVGDVITNGDESALVTRIKKNDTVHHICAGDGWWYSDIELEKWEKEIEQL